MSSLKYWLWLSTKPSFRCEDIAVLIDELGSPETVYYADRHELDEHFQLSEQQHKELAVKDFDHAERILESCSDRNVKILTMQDAVYPERLRALYSPPAVLYYRGNLPIIDEEAAIGIVGTRKPTAYGEMMALRLGFQLSKSGMLVVSGMASGIDGIAQKGALRAGKSTIAVLGTGPDIIYPAEHRNLYEDIVVAGTVISEYPPGTKGDRKSFPRRNRIISGLSLGVILVEAPIGSGALITANHALDQNRDIFAVPGSVDSRESAGCNRIIRDGARLITCAEDVISEYCVEFAHKLSYAPSSDAPPIPAASKRNREKEAPSKETADDTEAQSLHEVTVVDLSKRFSSFPREQQMILFAIAAEPQTADEIIRATEQSSELILSELSLMELEGIIQKTPGGRFQVDITSLPSSEDADKAMSTS